jgi:hypothetical protein
MPARLGSNHGTGAHSIRQGDVCAHTVGRPACVQLPQLLLSIRHPPISVSVVLADAVQVPLAMLANIGLCAALALS